MNQKYLYISLIAMVVLIGINIQNAWYIRANVRSDDAQKKVRLSQKKVEMMCEEYVKKKKRRDAYDTAMGNAKEEGGDHGLSILLKGN